MPEHVDITDPEIHEPKGVASANENEVYTADGAGSGSWGLIYTHGWEDINDGGVSQDLDTSYTYLTNDGTGTNTLNTYRLPGYNAIWDASNNEFDFAGAGLGVGDTVLVRMDFLVTTAGANSSITTAIDFAVGDAIEYELVYDKRQYKSADTHNLVVTAHFYLGNEQTLNNPAKIKMKSDNASDSVVVNGWFVQTMPRTVVIS